MWQMRLKTMNRSWKSPDTAPIGYEREIEREVKDPKGGTKIRKITIYVYERIMGVVGDWVGETYWIPPDLHHPVKSIGGRFGRWHKHNEGQELQGWMPLPHWEKEKK